MIWVAPEHAQHAVQTVQQIAQTKKDWDDKLLHYGLIAGGMLLWALLKGGFEWIANKFWRKVDEEAEDIKAYKAWKKSGKPQKA